MCEACWCAACARGGTKPPLPRSACGQTQAAQSPIAKMSSSRVVCSVGRTTSWLMRLVSSPAMSFRKSGALTPAAHTISSAGSRRPSASCTPSADDLGHLGVGVHFDTQLAATAPRRLPTAAAAGPEARASRPRSASTWMSLSASTRSSPNATTSRVVRCNSAASSTPVAPAPMMATCSCSGRTGVSCAWARMQALTMREWKRSASAGLELQPHGVFAHAGRAEVVALAADGDDQRVVAERALRGDLLAFVVDMGRHEALRVASRSRPDHFADAVAEVMPVRLRQVVHLVGTHVHAAGGDLVQLGLPDMGAACIDQRDLGLFATDPACRRGASPVRARPHRRRR